MIDPGLLCPICKKNLRRIGSKNQYLSSCSVCKEKRDKERREREKALRKQKRGIRKKTRSFLCPRCKNRERLITKAGNRKSYCSICRVEIDREKRKARGVQEMKDLQVEDLELCFHCQEEERFQRLNGSLSRYCWKCRKKKRMNQF